MPGFDDDDVPDFSQRVRAFTSRFDPQHPSLPLTHIAPMYAFRAIIGGNSIQPQHCDTLGEDLSYLFYGRPAFRAKRETGPKLKWSVPVLFILAPAKTYSIKRVVPFDSGAFKKGFYGNVFSDRSKLDHFLLEPSLEFGQHSRSRLAPRASRLAPRVEIAQKRALIRNAMMHSGAKSELFKDGQRECANTRAK